MKLDLDAKRKARQEATKEKHSVVYGGKTYQLPSELPFRIIELSQELTGPTAGQAMREIAEVMLNGKHEQFLQANPSVEDFNEFLEGVMEIYISTDDEEETGKD